MQENNNGEKEQRDGERDEFFEPVPARKDEPAPKKSKTAKRIGAVCAAVAVAAVGFLAGWLGRYYALDEGLRTFLWAKKTTENNYYQPIDEDALYDDLIAALENQIDRYSCFYTADEYAKIVRESEGQNVGIGIAVAESEGLPMLYTVVGNSPAELAGLRQGMYVVEYGKDGDSLQTGGVEQLFSFIDAQSGEFVFRCGYDKEGADAQNYTLTRREYLASYVRYRDSETSFAFRGEKELALTQTDEPLEGLDGKTAYIRLDEFNGNADTEFVRCLEKMKERGRENLILDLRGNGGGYMTTLCSIASHLMKNAKGGSPIVATAQYRNGKKVAFAADGNDYSDYFTQNSSFKVLADENTASASECLIGALVDYGTIGYGDIYLRKDAGTDTAKTYGKGIMQSHFPSASGDVMKLTVATIHWPVTGKCIQDVGVTEQDGAKFVVSPLIWGAEDVLLDAVIGA